jgi:hypothetical protein
MAQKYRALILEVTIIDHGRPYVGLGARNKELHCESHQVAKALNRLHNKEG